MIIKPESLSSAPILNMYVRHEVILRKIGEEVMDYVLGIISSGGSKLFTTFHIIHLYYTHIILAQRPQMLLVILQGN